MAPVKTPAAPKPARTRAAKPAAKRTSKPATPAATLPPTPVKIPKGCKPSRVLSKDQTRPVLANAHITQNRHEDDRWELHVTDSYKAIRLPLELVDAGRAELTAGSLDADTLKVLERDDSRLVANDTELVIDGNLRRRRENFGQYPNLDQLWPTTRGEVEIGFDVKHLADIAAAFGCDRVRLVIDTSKPNRPILVEPLNQRPKKLYGNSQPAPAPGATGLLMPVRLDAA